MKNILFFIPLCVSLMYAGIENELGINVENTSIYNEGGSKFTNYGMGLRYQLNRYVVSPRFDVDYVNISDYEGVNSLFKVSLNGVYEFENRSHFLPYGLMGMGYEYVSPSVVDRFESHFFVQGGAGVAYQFKEGYKTHFESRVVQILGGNQEKNEVIMGLGMSFPIGGKPQKVRRRLVVQKMLQPILVHSRKAHYIDGSKCPKKINRPDRDRDGVEDSYDQCPNTPCDFSVDRYGCPIKITLRINFANNSANIENYSLGRVEQFATFLLNNRGSQVKILGHTDSVGSSMSNLLLSQKRADAVAQKLIRLGVSPSRISMEGLGESQPIASNKTAQGRARNRRIEAILSYPNSKR